MQIFHVDIEMAFSCEELAADDAVLGVILWIKCLTCKRNSHIIRTHLTRNSLLHCICSGQNIIKLSIKWLYFTVKTFKLKYIKQ